MVLVNSNQTISHERRETSNTTDLDYTAFGCCILIYSVQCIQMHVGLTISSFQSL